MLGGIQKVPCTSVRHDKRDKAVVLNSVRKYNFIRFWGRGQFLNARRLSVFILGVFILGG